MFSSYKDELGPLSLSDEEDKQKDPRKAYTGRAGFCCVLCHLPIFVDLMFSS